MPKTKRSWSEGDLFAVPLSDGTYVLGQVLDLMLPNIVSVVFVDRRCGSLQDCESLVSDGHVSSEMSFSALSVWRDPLDEGRWRVVGRGRAMLPRDQWPNEPYRAQGWIGAKHYNIALVEGFLNAYYALGPWDRMADPHYYDRLLISPGKRPKKVMSSKVVPRTG